MKLAISNIAWNQEEDNQVYGLMKEYGFEGLEIAPTRFFDKNPYDTSLEELQELKKLMKKKEIKLISIQSLLFGQENIALFEGEENRKNLFNYLTKAIKFASNLGINTLVFGNPRNRVSNSEEDYDIAVNFFKKLGCIAAEHNTNICIEANPKKYNTNFINTTEEAIKLVRDVNTVGFKLHYDLGADLINNSDIKVLKNNIDILNHVHISEPFLETISKENIGIHKDLFELLNENNYSKWISIEMKKVSEGSNLENVKKCIKYLGDVINENV